MKSDVMPSRVQMEPGVLKTLMTEVKETVAKDYEMPKSAKPTFRAVNLWKIHRNSRLANGYFRRRSL
ncbi:MAG: hypothetical protein ACKVOW_10870 [Chitinophagaceae bacterium]